MTTMGDAAFWARKRLGILPRYRTVTAESARAEAGRIGLTVDAREAPIGVYTNPPGAEQSLVAITSTAVAVREPSAWGRMPYAALSAVRFEGGKDEWNVLTLVSADGRELAVHMPGDVEKPITSLATFLRKASAAEQVFDRAAIKAASARHREQWLARVMAVPGPTPLAAIGV